MILAEPSADTTVITGPCATTVDVQGWLDRAGWDKRTYSNGGVDAQFVLEGGYFPCD